METLASLKLKITQTSQQAEEANVKANEVVKAKENMEDTLLDHWLDGFTDCKEMVLTLDPTFDVGRLVPPISEVASGTRMEIEINEDAAAEDATIPSVT